jgi:hypothetical protein
MIAAVEDSTESAPGQKIMTELPRVSQESPSAIIAAKAQPFIFRCENEPSDQQGLSRLFELGAQ